jgi:hypothetical protein
LDCHRTVCQAEALSEGALCDGGLAAGENDIRQGKAAGERGFSDAQETFVGDDTRQFATLIECVISEIGDRQTICRTGDDDRPATDEPAMVSAPLLVTEEYCAGNSPAISKAASRIMIDLLMTGFWWTLD